jgi:hypothetical protein
MDISIYLLLIVLHTLFLLLSLRVPIFALFNIILLLFSIAFVITNSPITQFYRQCVYNQGLNEVVCNNYEYILIDNPYGAIILAFIFIFQIVTFIIKMKI